MNVLYHTSMNMNGCGWCIQQQPYARQCWRRIVQYSIGAGPHIIDSHFCVMDGGVGIRTISCCSEYQ